jgi:hypothetical protein
VVKEPDYIDGKLEEEVGISTKENEEAKVTGYFGPPPGIESTIVVCNMPLERYTLDFCHHRLQYVMLPC